MKVMMLSWVDVRRESLDHGRLSYMTSGISNFPSDNDTSSTIDEKRRLEAIAKIFKANHIFAQPNRPMDHNSTHIKPSAEVEGLIGRGYKKDPRALAADHRPPQTPNQMPTLPTRQIRRRGPGPPSMPGEPSGRRG